MSSKMVEFTAKVQALGRVAIPKVIRESEGIKMGDVVKVTVEKKQKPVKG